VPRCPVCDRRIRADAACPWDGGRVEPRPVDAPATPLLPGVVIERLVGVGGGGAVWAGQRGGEPVAVKMAHTGSPLMHARFAREAEAMRRVGPPAALRLLETGVLDERPYLVMELATHRTLADELAALEEPPPAAWVLARGAALLDALEAVHRAGVVHRDLKPEHVILPPGRARLLDFGLALEPQHSADPRLTAAGTVAGTPHYMAPEQLRDDAIDARADIYAFGVIFYEMLTLRPPFTGDEGSIAHGHLMLRPPPPARGDAPPALADVALACLAKQPGSRPASAAQLRAALGAAASAPRAPVRAPPAVPPAGFLGARREPVLVVAARGCRLPALAGRIASAGARLARQHRAWTLAVFLLRGDDDVAAAAAELVSWIGAAGGRARLRIAEMLVRGPADVPGGLRGADLDQPDAWLADELDGVAEAAEMMKTLRAAARPARPELVGREETIAATLDVLAVRPALVTLVGDTGAGKSRVLAEIGISLGPRATVRSVDGRRSHLEAELLRPEEGRPLVLLVDDVDHIPPTGLDALEAALTSPGLAGVVTARPAFLADRRGWGRGAGRRARLELAALSPEAAYALCADLLRPALDLPAALARELLAWTGRNPGLMVTAAQVLHAAGAVRPRRDRRGTFVAGEALETLRPTLRQWLAGRLLDRLQPETAAVARIAALLGLDGDLLEAVLGRVESAGQPIGDLRVALDDLCARGVVVADAGGLAFASASLSEALRRGVAEADAAYLHRLALDHWHRASASGARPAQTTRDPGRWLAAAREARREERVDDALDSLRTAQALAVDRGDARAAAAALLEESAVRDIAGDPAAAERARVAADRLAPDDSELTPRRCLARGRSRWRAGDLVGARADLDAAARAAAAAGDLDTAIDARTLIARVLAALGHHDLARAALVEALDDATHTGDRRRVSSLRRERSAVRLAEGDSQGAAADLRDAAELAREIGDQRLERLATVELAELTYLDGEDAEAARLARHALELSRGRGTAPDPDVHLLLARIHAAGGHHEDARRWLAAAEQESDRIEWSPDQRAIADLLACAEDEAWTELFESLDEPGLEEARLEALYHRAAALAARGRIADARARIAEAGARLGPRALWRGRFARLANLL